MPSFLRGARLSSVLLAVLLMLPAPGCMPAREPIEKTQQPLTPAPIEGPLWEQPEEVKASDFRVRPPAVTRIQARRGGDGNTVVEVRFAPDGRVATQRRVRLLADDQPWDLSDDGTGVDLKAGDGVFSTTTPVPFGEIVDEQRKIRELLAAQKIAGIQRFASAEAAHIEPVTPMESGAVFDLIHSIALLIAPERSLTITAVPVVEDPTRTSHPCTGAGAPMGAWSFGHLMTEMANGGDPALLIESLFGTLRTGGTAPNSLHLSGVSDVQTKILAPWPHRFDGHVVPTRAPLKLLAIVNRIDLAGNTSFGAVGGAEGRFVFEVMDRTQPGCHPLGSTGDDPLGTALIILEYGVPIYTCTDLRKWAAAWIELGAHAPGTAAYNSALEALTEKFVARGVAPGKANGSALNQIRINEIALTEDWNLKQLRLTRAGLGAGNISQTPDFDFDDGHPHAADLATWVNGHASSILAHRHRVPAFLGAAPFLGVQVINRPSSFWLVPGAASNEVRHAFSMDTCNGCHGLETGTEFVHIGHPLGVPIAHEAGLSPFLTGSTAPDPVDSTVTHTFNELQRRAAVLENIASSVCRSTPEIEADFQEPRLRRPFRLPIPPIDVQPLLLGH